MNNRRATNHASDNNNDATCVASEKDANPLRPAWWSHLWQVLLTPTTTGRLPPGPLRRPLVGYLVAIVLQVLALLCLIWLAQTNPTFHSPGDLLLLAISLTALGWGIGPTILATISTIALLVYSQHNLLLSTILAENGTSIFFHFVIGLIICILACQLHHTRYKATAEMARLHRYYEELAAQLQTEREAQRED